MRIRTIKPEFWQNERLAEVSEGAHMLAAALLSYVDDEGLFNANPQLIHAALYPIRPPSIPVESMLDEISRIDYIRFVRGTDGRTYGWIVSFKDHQVINKPTPSKILNRINGFPEPTVALPDTSGSPTVGLLDGKEQGKERKGTGNSLVRSADAEPDPTRQAAAEVVSRVNQAAGQSWRRPHKHLVARLREGATPDECLLVTECKKAEWQGTEWEQYVRQKTLFAPGNFDDYLVQAQKWDSAGRPPKNAGKPGSIDLSKYREASQ